MISHYQDMSQKLQNIVVYDAGLFWVKLYSVLNHSLSESYNLLKILLAKQQVFLYFSFLLLLSYIYFDTSFEFGVWVRAILIWIPGSFALFWSSKRNNYNCCQRLPHLPSFLSFLVGPNVTYWPSTEPSINRCTFVNKRKNSETGASSWRYRNITLTCGRGWIRWRWQMRTPTGSTWMSDNYITSCQRRLGSVISELQFQMQLESVADKMPAWESACWLRACGPQWPTVEQPSQNSEELLLWSEELLVNM